LDKHLQRHHQNEYESIVSEIAKKKLKLQASTSAVQTKLTPLLESISLVYQECLLNWMINSYQPLSAIQNILFCKMRNKKALVKSEYKSQRMMSKKYFETLQAITVVVVVVMGWWWLYLWWLWLLLLLLLCACVCVCVHVCVHVHVCVCVCVCGKTWYV
jgi:hypothetical protein